MSAFIDAHRDRFGVEPICRVLSAHGHTIAPSTYYAAKSRPRSTRSIRDEVVLAHIVRVHESPMIGRRTDYYRHINTRTDPVPGEPARH